MYKYKLMRYQSIMALVLLQYPVGVLMVKGRTLLGTLGSSTSLMKLGGGSLRSN